DGLGLLAMQVRLHALLVHVAHGRAHDEQAQEQGETGQDLVRGYGGEPEGVPDDRQDDEDLGETGTKQKKGRSDRQYGHQQQDDDRAARLAVRAVDLDAHRGGSGGGRGARRPHGRRRRGGHRRRGGRGGYRRRSGYRGGGGGGRGG